MRGRRRPQVNLTPDPEIRREMLLKDISPTEAFEVGAKVLLGGGYEKKDLNEKIRKTKQLLEFYENKLKTLIEQEQKAKEKKKNINKIVKNNADLVREHRKRIKKEITTEQRKNGMTEKGRLEGMTRVFNKKTGLELKPEEYSDILDKKM